ncbi:MAG: hypothetical protein US68_C0003G0003 [Candidatus Shapirobacteria bacterium GW2011_GWE1_38_10]|uniref:Uncharacterized protein n=1 Tax=Candidatus Shapirobacteria bacterium GW2011_GWE1_38_10 TaxID=1618488 RepID=A0A0G0I7Z9_9BACT|nr:MAG: hypothetical protein US46_C0012G0010 [Candidatus Shapirobacteria bacterium GW2011_GWF2_37_20]KKQ50637.1 MAG: hypothetical protein US68_C0003G0003 [Candidatus Shapirobacteria bacterium GW2011_GWE1_38_10]KKQ62608.1 MAG: hypothetical protein US85_C0024G0007 [Candidatus Shapirobacteria bacterium GW2011_GWF1_38_23]HBP51452.1 hypothetical protein [Candidatus Shapirobacteria bacterium]
MKKKKSISDQTLSVINRRQIKPIPRWEFIAKNWGLWTGLILCLILLVLGFALSIFGVVGNIIVPYLWLFIAAIFFGLSYFLFEKTKGAYHFPRWQVVVAIVALALIVGGAFFKIGLANRLDNSLENNFPGYRRVVPMRIQAWSNPGSGYLSGTITKIVDSDNFELKDFSGKSWIITANNTLIRGRVIMTVGEEIKLIGSQTADNAFSVREIRPWTGMGQNMMKENY